jgi:Zn finger protein HypA/HybF involved in hydrogenase expression
VPAKLTTEQFIEKARAVHGDRYDYSHVIYEKAHTPVEILCRDHGPFIQRPTNHLSGMGCPECWKENRDAASLRTAKEAADTFVQKARNVHGWNYDYSKVKYKNSGTKVTIICPEHGEFRQVPNSHLRGAGCPKCGDKRTAQKKRRSFESFVTQANAVHDGVYRYYKTAYEGVHKKTRIRCAAHGDYYQQPANHMSGQGCPLCGREKRGQVRTERWLEGLLDKFYQVHGERYDYSEVDATNSITAITVICEKHGQFSVRPSNHLTGHGCPKCAKEDSPQFIDARIKNDEEFAGRDGMLYLLRVTHPKAPKTLYKIGITSLGGLDQRFGNRSLYSGFDFEMIDHREGTMREMWSLERKIKRKIKSEKSRVTKFCDDFWHWTESFYWPKKPTLGELLGEK